MTANGFQDVRRQKVARKAGQNMGAGYLNTDQNLAQVYAPMMYVDNQNFMSVQQQMQMQ